MLVDYLDLTGAPAAFNAERFIHLRPTFAEFEPEGAIHIKLDGDGFHSLSTLEDVSTALSAICPVCQLTTPNGLTFVVAAGRVLNVSEPPTGEHHPAARSVLKLLVYGGAALVRPLKETVEEARAALEASLGGY